jgi:hypothetical protein
LDFEVALFFTLNVTNTPNTSTSQHTSFPFLNIPFRFGSFFAHKRGDEASFVVQGKDCIWQLMCSGSDFSQRPKEFGNTIWQASGLIDHFDDMEKEEENCSYAIRRTCLSCGGKHGYGKHPHCRDYVINKKPVIGLRSGHYKIPPPLFTEIFVFGGGEEEWLPFDHEEIEDGFLKEGEILCGGVG